MGSSSGRGVVGNSNPRVSMSDYDHLFKVLLIGDAGVGKSSMLLRFTENTFDEDLGATIGVDFKVKVVEAEGGKRIKLTLWDTAGHERFRTLTSSYYRGAQGIILVYDVTRIDTFRNLQRWLEEVEVYTPGGASEVIKLLFGNKVDCASLVTRSEAQDWARRKGMMFIESSAKASVGVSQAFEEIINKILENPVLLASTTPGKKKIDLNKSRLEGNTQGCC